MTPIRVLIIDDSAFARKVIREVLERDHSLGSPIEVVGIARDGLEGLEKIADLMPDVVTLDLVMPDLDGIGLLRALPKDSQSKIIVVSVSSSETDLAILALELGAIDVVTKPTPLPTDRLYDLAPDLVAKVRAAASAKRRIGSDEPVVISAPVIPQRRIETNLVVIGTSTGGPQALTQLFKALPSGLPVPILIALHIPAGYTAPLAMRLTKLGNTPVDEAVDGGELLAGRAYIAPGGMHLKALNKNGRLFAGVMREPLSSVFHPSVNILFESAATAGGAGVIGVILTGMGDDGMLGSKAIREAGGRVIAESASSCVVYGMPRTVIEGGFASFESSLEKIPSRLVEAIYAVQVPDLLA